MSDRLAHLPHVRTSEELPEGEMGQYAIVGMGVTQAMWFRTDKGWEWRCEVPKEHRL